jgi:hypothetical protein
MAMENRGMEPPVGQIGCFCENDVFLVFVQQVLDDIKVGL